MEEIPRDFGEEPNGGNGGRAVTPPPCRWQLTPKSDRPWLENHIRQVRKFKTSVAPISLLPWFKAAARTDFPINAPIRRQQSTAAARRGGGGGNNNEGRLSLSRWRNDHRSYWRRKPGVEWFSTGPQEGGRAESWGCYGTVKQRDGTCYRVCGKWQVVSDPDGDGGTWSGRYVIEEKGMPGKWTVEHEAGRCQRSAATARMAQHQQQEEEQPVERRWCFKKSTPVVKWAHRLAQPARQYEVLEEEDGGCIFRSMRSGRVAGRERRRDAMFLWDWQKHEGMEWETYRSTWNNGEREVREGRGWTADPLQEGKYCRWWGKWTMEAVDGGGERGGRRKRWYKWKGIYTVHDKAMGGYWAVEQLDGLCYKTEPFSAGRCDWHYAPASSVVVRWIAYGGRVVWIVKDDGNASGSHLWMEQGGNRSCRVDPSSDAARWVVLPHYGGLRRHSAAGVPPGGCDEWRQEFRPPVPEELLPDGERESIEDERWREREWLAAHLRAGREYWQRIAEDHRNNADNRSVVSDDTSSYSRWSGEDEDEAILRAEREAELRRLLMAERERAERRREEQRRAAEWMAQQRAARLQRQEAMLMTRLPSRSDSDYNDYIDDDEDDSLLPLPDDDPIDDDASAAAAAAAASDSFLDDASGGGVRRDDRRRATADDGEEHFAANAIIGPPSGEVDGADADGGDGSSSVSVVDYQLRVPFHLAVQNLISEWEEVGREDNRRPEWYTTSDDDGEGDGAEEEEEDNDVIAGDEGDGNVVRRHCGIFDLLRGGAASNSGEEEQQLFRLSEPQSHHRLVRGKAPC